MNCYDCGEPATNRRCRDGEYRCAGCIKKGQDARRAQFTKNWRQEHPDRVRVHRQVQHANHWQELYVRTKTVRVEVYNPSYQARRRGAFEEHVNRRSVWERDEGHCRIKLVCDGVFVPFEEMHLDHVVPISKGGKHCYANVQTSCGPCNLTKSDKLTEGVS